MLECTHIVKRYHRQLILDSSSLQLTKGIYWIQGANGTGKTTFLKMAAALIPFDGDIRLNGISQKAAPFAYRQQVSWAEAEPLYPDFLTGSELIALYRKVRKATPADTEALVHLFDAGTYLPGKVGTYSAGMLKKLSLILAFTGPADLVLLDEPFITLDTAACRRLEQLILERHRETGTTFILSSHQEPGQLLLPRMRILTVQNKTITH
ncbi:ABC transporter ATP-binding protein [Niabella beijingensis]|nr:ATP-binding cassette domain-containing protein [Niabella beijingensis]MBZ4190851.1 ATP-binding cassette domain-containing protein [Niabella beijingensis]